MDAYNEDLRSERKPAKRRGKWIVPACLLLLAAGLLAVWLLTADLRLYHKGVAAMNAGDNTAAAEFFAALPGYRDSDALLQRIRYAIASDLLEQDAFLEAAAIFTDLGDYRDSIGKMGKCYYRQATNERLAKNYEAARDHFTLAGEYQDAPFQAQRTIYAAGHDAFLAQDYDTADSWFTQLEGEQSDYGNPHFRTLADAAPYLQQQLEELSQEVRFHLGEEPDENFYYAMDNLLPYHTGYPTYYAPDKLVYISSIHYYTGDRILDAWEKGDISGLSEDENAVLKLALELVGRAESETDSDLAKQVWLHDWLCEKVTYESPDMDVDLLDYIQLRQLSCIGAMLDGAANCQGYTDAFYLLGNLAGFEVRRLSGTTGNGHIWNMIRLDGLWYVVDVTFDDLSDAGIDGRIYTYFNVPLDPDTYSVYGGPEVLPDMAAEARTELTWFGLTGSSFADLDGAADHLAEEYVENDLSWSYVMIENAEVSRDAVSDAILDCLEDRYWGYVQWTQWVNYYGGNTYITVNWEA